MNEHFDVAVVGGGPGGLVTAARAARLGAKVVVLEQAAQPGGFGRSPALGGLPVNLGPHALYLGGTAHRALQELGVPLTGFVPGGPGFFESDGALVPMPMSVGGLLGASWLSWRERVELALSLREVLGAPPAGTFADWLARRRSGQVRAFFATLMRVSSYVNAPQLLSAARAFSQLRQVVSPRSQGVLYLDDGWQGFVDALAKRVEVRCASRVTKVEPGRVHLQGGAVLEASQVALAVPLAAAASMLGQPAPGGLVPVRAACLDLVLRTLPKPERRLVFGLDEPTYFSVHTAPGGAPLRVHALWYLPCGGPEEDVAAKLEAFVDRAQPGWRDVLVERRYFPHMRVMEDVPRDEPLVFPTPRGVHLLSGATTRSFIFDAVVEAGQGVLAALASPGAAAR
ncbi:MAG: FAD-dependent oxidoreductase [Myxococcaceae bacterium]